MNKQDYDHQYYLVHRETHLARVREYQQKHKAEIDVRRKERLAELPVEEREARRARKSARWNANKESNHERQRQWRRTPKGIASVKESKRKYQEKKRSEKWRDQERHLRCTYGLSRNKFSEILAGQGNCCALCGAVKNRFVVDHDHLTGKIRGILCWSCNTGIGHKERFDRLQLNEKLAAYLKEGH